MAGGTELLPRPWHHQGGKAWLANVCSCFAEWCDPAKTLPRNSKLSNSLLCLHSHNCFALEVVVHHVPFTSPSKRLDFTSLHF